MKKRYLLPLAAAACAGWLFSAPASAATKAVTPKAATSTTAAARQATQAATTKPVSEIAERPIAGNVTLARPDFGKEPPEIDKKLLQSVRFRLTPAQGEALLPEDAAPETISIFGAAEATPEQMAAFLLRRNPHPKLNCSASELVRAYYEEAGREGIRPDVALCQALKETGFFAYGGDVVPSQNNFCGLGTTGGGVRGAAFATPQLGVRAHIQHLLAYASKERPHTAVVDPRYELIVHDRPDIHGSVTRWTGLNGVWAVPGTTYGQDILRLWSAAKAPDASDAALAAAERNVRQSPDEAKPYLYRGIVYEKRGDLEKAKADYEIAVKFDASGTALYDLARLQRARGDAKAAARAYDNLLDAHPAFSAAAWYDRGLLYLADKKPKDAIAAFTRALQLNPQSAPAQNAIGVAEVQRKNEKAAWAAFQRAAQINNSDFDVLANQIVFAACKKEKR